MLKNVSLPIVYCYCLRFDEGKIEQQNVITYNFDDIQYLPLTLNTNLLQKVRIILFKKPLFLISPQSIFWKKKLKIHKPALVSHLFCKYSR